MHYVRLLRPAKLQNSAAGLVISVLFTITTDLGDSFLCPEDGFIDIFVTAFDSAVGPPNVARASLSKQKACRCRWTTGKRVLEAHLNLRPGLKRETLNCTVEIYPARRQHEGLSTPTGALHVYDVLPRKSVAYDTGNIDVIVPATFEFINGVCSPVSIRTLVSSRGPTEKGLNLQVEEDIGESIARHIWDAGVVASAHYADSSSSPTVTRALFPIKNGSFNVLELGSGVGILGLTIASILPGAASAQGERLEKARVLLTDLEEAEERARSNIARYNALLAAESEQPELDSTAVQNVTVEYENLDWDDGCEGRFGPLAAAVPWDLVVLSDCTYNVDSLPALVGTLSALHAAKERHLGDNDGLPITSTVLLATKPRHSSEKALFGLLDNQNWLHRVVNTLPLPKVHEDDEVVLIYLLQKTRSASGVYYTLDDY